MNSTEVAPTTPPKPGNKKKSTKSKAHRDSEYQAGEPRPHHRYYFPTGDLLFQVNSALFKVHRHFLIQHSMVIRDMLEAPGSVMRQEEELIEVSEKPLFIMSGDSVRGWECVLAPFYRDDPFSAVKYNAEEWAALLVVANKYLMAGMEADAIKGLKQARPPLDMVQLMIIAQKVQSDELYQLALQSLAQRDQMLSLEEAQRIGLKAFHDVVTTEHVYFVRTRREMLGAHQPGYVGSPTRIKKNGFAWGAMIDSD
ncbi:hypothetical protein FRC15_009056 [Serendipita sp. 397]|nr:hypothetical protein FRC15_009056 [Serendipita sp. 397]KAG8797567.1 hypothetical protein FRC16_008737 [Serendipita sp. 398]KAG8823078.1 hypothetical protein FRC18_010821 [Serendipita sp. 400]